MLCCAAPAQEVLLPTPTNVNTIHVPGDELLNFIRVQQWVEDKCKSPLPLLNGAFVLVSSRDIPELCSKDIQDACGYGRSSSSRSFVRAVGENIPWRLRQIEAVEAGSGSEPGQALLLLEGGGCVKASMVSCDGLADVQGHEVSLSQNFWCRTGRAGGKGGSHIASSLSGGCARACPGGGGAGAGAPDECRLQ